MGVTRTTRCNSLVRHGPLATPCWSHVGTREITRVMEGTGHMEDGGVARPNISMNQNGTLHVEVQCIIIKKALKII